MRHKHLLLAVLLHVGLAAVAQDDQAHTVIRNVEVIKGAQGTTVTIITQENGAQNKQVLTGAEAEQWLAEHDRDAAADKGPPGTVKASVLELHYADKNKKTPHKSVSQEVAVALVNDEGTVAVNATSGGSAEPHMDRSPALDLYPDPNDGHFSISFMPPGSGTSLITIVDASGREVFREYTEEQGRVLRTIDLSQKGKGMYIATLTQGDTTISKRLVVE